MRLARINARHPKTLAIVSSSRDTPFPPSRPWIYTIMKLFDFSFPCLTISRPKSPSSFFCRDVLSPSTLPNSDSSLDPRCHEFDPIDSKIYAYYWKPLSLHHLEYNENRRRNCMNFFFEISNLLASQTTIEQLDKIDLRLVYLSLDEEQSTLILPWRSAVSYSQMLLFH
jgi:hypothetical protein